MNEERILALAEEANRIAKETAVELKKIRKELLWTSILRIAVWLVLAGVPIFIYLHLVKPPLENVFGSYDSVFEKGH